MSVNFEKSPDNFADPSRVRNFLKDAQNDAERKQYSMVFHVIYALVCSLAVYLAADASVFSASQGTSIIFMCLAPAMCVFTFLYSPVYLKAAPVALPLLLVLIKFAATGFKQDFFSVASVLFMYILCILSAAVIAKAVISGYTKTTLFVMLSVVFGIICFCQVMFAFISVYGTFSFSLLLDTINSAFDSLVNQSVALSQTPEGLEAFRSIAVSGTELTDAQITELVKDSMQMSVDTLKPCLPSFFVLSCMLYGFVAVTVFSLFAKHFKINVFVCIMDKNWTYRPSIVSSVVYDIVFFVFIISMFLNLPQNVSVTAMNLMFVLTPLMFISGVRGIYSMLFKKTRNSGRSAFFTALIIIAATMILGGISFLLVGSVGVTFISARNREEKSAVPVKYASDMVLLREMTENAENGGNEEKTNTDNQDNPENQ